MSETIFIKGLYFCCTCGSSPEQYEVFKGKEHVGYVRLRYGYLSCEYPDLCGELLYEYEFSDFLLGSFDSEEQRKYYLGKIADRILEKIK